MKSLANMIIEGEIAPIFNLSIHRKKINPKRFQRPQKCNFFKRIRKQSFTH